MAWWENGHCTYGELLMMVTEAERLNFVENGTAEDVRQGKIWQTTYLQPCMLNNNMV